MKPRYNCELMEIVLVSEGKVAIVKRKEPHERLGPPDRNRYTRTSLIVRHDTAKREIETLNSIYIYT